VEAEQAGGHRFSAVVRSRRLLLSSSSWGSEPRQSSERARRSGAAVAEIIRGERMGWWARWIRVVTGQTDVSRTSPPPSGSARARMSTARAGLTRIDSLLHSCSCAGAPVLHKRFF
jgi:hypothetical protein